MAAKKKAQDAGENPQADREEDASIKMVRIRVTKFGDGKISTGVHRAGYGDVMAGRGHEMEADLETAETLEAAGFAEIVENQG